MERSYKEAINLSTFSRQSRIIGQAIIWVLTSVLPLFGFAQPNLGVNPEPAGTVATSVSAIDLSLYLKKVSQNNAEFKAFEEEKMAAIDRANSGDLELGPMMTILLAESVNKRQPGQFGFGMTSFETKELTIGESQLFSSGTRLSFFAQMMDETMVADPIGKTLWANGALGVSLVQNLWQNSFGRATRLRWEREASLVQVEKGAIEIRSRYFLLEAENLFWAYLAAKANLNLRKSSLLRAKKLETWMTRRLRDGLGDKSDLLGIQSLVESRKLQILAAESDIKSLEAHLHDLLGIQNYSELPVFSGNIYLKRNLEVYLDGSGKGDPTRLEAFIAQMEAKTKSTVAEEVREGLNPELNFEASYNTNSYEPGGTSFEVATQHWTQTNTPTYRVALNFKYLFDTSAKTSKKNQALRDAAASKLKAEQKTRESQTGWVDLKRRYEELSLKIDSAARLAKIQNEKAKAESVKLTRGRTVTANVVSAEQEADDSEMSVMGLQVEQRKLEATGRLYVRVDNP